MAEAVTWTNVLACFADRGDPVGVIHRLAGEWAARYGIAYTPLGPGSAVRQEEWTDAQIDAHLSCMGALVPALVTSVPPPRRWDGPLVLIDFGAGRVGQIDGRRRANVWRHTPGWYAVLIVEAG